MHSLVQKNICNLAFDVVPAFVTIHLEIMLVGIFPMPRILVGDPDVIWVYPFEFCVV